MTLSMALLLGGLIAVTIGADALVRGARSLAKAIGLSPLVIGLTVVAFGTSSPEIAVSVRSALEGELGAGLAVGNVIGSNLFNVLVVVGLSAVVAPVLVSRQLVRADVPLLIVASVLVWALASDGTLGLVDGLILVSALVAYTTSVLVTGRRQSQRQPARAVRPTRRRPRDWARDTVFVVGGLALLVVGANWLVSGAVDIARSLGVSELVIGLTIVAAGTSLPELATSAAAGLKREGDLAVGNAIGSCLYNLLGVLGLATLAAPSGLSVARGAINFDFPVMIAVAIACLTVFFTGYRIARWEGWVFLGYYAAYTVYLILKATEHHALGSFTVALWGFVIPLTLLTLGVGVVRQVRRNRRA